jgi:hypothetical protein
MGPLALVLLVVSAFIMQQSVAPVTPKEPATDRHWERSISLCGVSFKAPDDWIASRDPQRPYRETCSLELKAKNYDRLLGRDSPVHFWMISIEVLPETFEELMDSYDIHREADRWFVGGGAREQPAYEIKGPNWWGLRVDHFSMRSSAREGSGSFESEAVLAIMSSTTSKHTAVAVAGSGADDQPLPLMLNTFRFEAK